MKPDEARLTPNLEYYITELLNLFPKDFASNIRKQIYSRLFLLKNIVFCATNARSTWYEWGDSWRVLKELLHKLNLNEQIILRRNFSVFALDNDGFRYVLAKASGVDLSPYSEDALVSWKRSSIAAIEMMKRIRNMTPLTTISILSLNESFKAVQQMLYVRDGR